MSHIKVNNILIDVVRKKIKYMHLAVYPPEGRVRIAVPLSKNNETVRLYAASKIAWIKKQQKKFENQDRESKREFISRESHYFLGKRYLLNVIEHNAPPKIELRNKAFIDMYIRKGSSLEKRKSILKEWYREKLKEMIPSLLDKWQKITGLKVNNWIIKQMKTRWGSCKIETKTILLNLELVKKPYHCLEFIILHELVHLLERHHNEKYIAYMNKFMPNWRLYKEELNRSPLNYQEWS